MSRVHDRLTWTGPPSIRAGVAVFGTGHRRYDTDRRYVPSCVAAYCFCSA